MYCVNCGVKLADTERQCPLCGTVPFHPDIDRPKAEPLYPTDRYPTANQLSKMGILVIISTMFMIPLIITLLCDLSIHRAVTWSGYVVGALVMSYVLSVLPMWFKSPNPVVFVPCDFAAVGLYLFYINFAAGGRWFLSFALPLVGFLALLVTAVITLLKYVRRGVLYIFGGAIIALGLFMPLMESLINWTFGHSFVWWSLYPLTVLVLVGGMLIFLAICRPARESMQRRFFI